MMNHTNRNTRKRACSVGILSATLVLVTYLAVPRVLAAPVCGNTSVGFLPLTDLGRGTYKGAQGGLYPNGENDPPQSHLNAGVELAQQIVPLDQQGQFDPNNGKIVLLAIGMSNTKWEFQTFHETASADPQKNPRLVTVNGAIASHDAKRIANPRNKYWEMVDELIAESNATPEQVQAAWLKQAVARPTGGFSEEAGRLTDYLIVIVQIMRERYPNLKLVYVSSRIYAGYAIEDASNPEPYAYEGGFAVKALIEKQLNGDPELNYDERLGEVRAPWLAWGPYMWADGLRARSDGLIWACEDFREDDGMHPGDSAREKVADMLLEFLKSNPTSRPWFVSTERIAVSPSTATLDVGEQQRFAVQAFDRSGEPIQISNSKVRWTVSPEIGVIDETGTFTAQAVGTTRIGVRLLSDETVYAWTDTITIVPQEPLGGATFDLRVPNGVSFVHIPLAVAAVNGEPMTVGTVGGFYEALGGAENVNFIVIRDTSAEAWRSFLGNESRNSAADAEITAEMGMITVMKNRVMLKLEGNALGENGVGRVRVARGINIVGLPLEDQRLERVSDLLSLEGIAQNALVAITTLDGEFKLVARPEDEGDLYLSGGQAFAITAQHDSVAVLQGHAWDNEPAPSSGPPQAGFSGLGTLDDIATHHATPVLVIQGGIVVDSTTGSRVPEVSITAKNLTTGAIARAATNDGSITKGRYSLVFVDMVSSQAAQIGDDLLMTVALPDDYTSATGTQTYRHTVTEQDIIEKHIDLKNLWVTKIPSKTRLLPNYPNPFNPETWIPYELSKDTPVFVEVYNPAGQLVRALNLGFQTRGSYINRERAAYWDGRNDYGEKVASGVYLYVLKAEDYTEGRKLVILK